MESLRIILKNRSAVSSMFFSKNAVTLYIFEAAGWGKTKAPPKRFMRLSPAPSFFVGKADGKGYNNEQ